MQARDYQPGELVPGTVYRVVRRIGAGGMGTVYDVEDTTIGKRYVLKTLHPQLGSREDLARRMKNEARTLARLNHSNIVEVFTAGVTSDDLRLPYYVMERLNGQSLRVVLEKKGRLERQHAYHIGIDLLDALDHAHDKGVIHRDVKPDNIFLHRTPAGVTVTKLLDFGIVSLLDDGTRETAGRFLGTLRYAAPEQLRGEKPTPKTDVYAAGLVMYEILAGRGPFDDEADAHRIGAAHINKPAPLVSRFVAVPRELENLLMAALSKDPSLRPRDAFSFAASLRNLKRSEGGSLMPSESTENRETLAGSVGPRAVNVMVRPHEGQSRYVVTPSRAPAAFSSHSSEGPTSFETRMPNTTAAGMFTPTLGPSVASSSVMSSSATSSTFSSSASSSSSPTSSPTATSAHSSFEPATLDWIDRAGSTRSSVGYPGSAYPHQGSTAILTGASPALARSTPVPEPPTPLEWPVERGTFLSEGPQVRSLPAIHAVATSWKPAIAASLAAATLLFVGAFALVEHGTARPTSAATSGPTSLHAEPPPSASPVVVVPAPTLDVPSIDEPPGAPPARAASAPAAKAIPEEPLVRTAPLARAAPLARTAPSPAHSATAAPVVKAPPPAATRVSFDRPGPGF
jgi:serine/threonine protein kinase